MNPNDKVQIRRRRMGDISAVETNAQYLIGNLTPEVLRDIARNESADRAWRKAAVRFLLDRSHKYSNHHELAELVAEIREEQEAEKEVQSLVESATEQPLE